MLFALQFRYVAPTFLHLLLNFLSFFFLSVSSLPCTPAAGV